MHLQPDALFVVACPVCEGLVATTAKTCGQDACCPLCASLFRVPFPPEQAASPAPPDAPEPASVGEDWEGVIVTLVPPRQASGEGEPPVVIPAAFEPPAAEPAATMAEPPLSAQPPAMADAGTEADEPLPVIGSAAVVPRTDELAFTEPVRTVRVGNETIEIRRLSPEERRARRVRRNLLMIVVGVSILMAIVVLAGFPPRR